MKVSKRIVALLLSFVMIFSFVACENVNETKKESQAEETDKETKKEESKNEAKGNTFEGVSKGYAGDVKAMVTIENGEIKDIKVEAEKETPTIGGAASEKLAEQIVKSNSTKVEAVSGATMTSNALIEAVNQAIKAAGLNPEDLKAKEVAEDKLDLNQEADIVVVGAGGAGLTSAIKATEAGKKVVIVEKAGNTGGNTNRATGGMNAAETHYQKEAKIEDTVEQFIADTMKGGHDKNNPELVKTLAGNSSKAIDWLDSIDAKLSDVGLAGGATNKRQHRPVDDKGKILSVGTYLVEKLTKKAEDLGIKIIYSAKVDEILMDGNKVSGVTAETEDGKLTVKAKSVIVASGGFGGNDALVSKYRPELKGYVSTNAPEIQGDAIAFLEKVGADFVDMDQIQTHPTVVQKDGSLISESLRGDGAILLNKEGKRFTDEMQTRDYVSNKINEQTDKTAWLVVDQQMFEKSKVVSKYVDKSLLVKADDFAGIAKVLGADAKTVEKTLTDWTSYIKAGEDKEFNHKNLDAVLSDLAKGPYYVGPVGPGIHHTMGGVKIDTKAQVLNKEGQPIKGLFAAGEVTGGVHGGNRLGGNAVTDIIVFGGIAGESAAEYVK
ncbi:flavocytochrome c [Helcococcus kunzii]|uniref:flavocytochrome c n=1 Tax=Helcococcus kunzii TaxID=40091 RepID=UPI001BAF1375|nr:flavocytochrome c [Helcococcus kunzii]MCT1795847.1 flavocytochrome c [Helcococcus kunzii]MCT1988601.1 flavocytochrome c [Helcococcus kunzii]QUY65135.1 flavocytochrome c [Helcococcus kunzii]